MFTCDKLNHVGRCSGDDPPSVGIVQSIEVHPWHSPHPVCHRSHPILDFLFHSQHSERARRCVKRGSVSRTLYNKLFPVLPIT